MFTLLLMFGASVPNNILSGGQAAHVGQFFCNQGLVNAVEATYPYNTNAFERTTNADDRVSSTETAGTSYDLVSNYVFLGDSLPDGILAWIAVVVNVSVSYDTSYASILAASGGVYT
ncbi:hypothetical protein BDV29DRAFT_154195 [Aspergillus leporis]|uniref:Uncharacterized protein n=1 Tax=Aspergillus leporis TaxID=41062 RepID=A0A5N5XBN1_9EURO|nr:hypothetical protein BDV29DRAFT_154195 [Aspergillus leporis]